MSGRWLRRKADGEVFAWNAILAARVELEEVSEEIAFPERFLSDEHKKRVPRVSLADTVVPEESASVASAPEAVGLEATRSVKKVLGSRKLK